MPQLALALYDCTSNEPPQQLPDFYDDTPENREFLRRVILRYCDWTDDHPGTNQVLGVFVVSEIPEECSESAND